jgi:hypothetical protein
MPMTMNSKPRILYKCTNTKGIEFADDRLDNLHLIFIEPCGLEFKTCGLPIECPKCYCKTLITIGKVR